MKVFNKVCSWLSTMKYEIIGQWHAGCFICNQLNHDGHDIMFSTDVWALIINRVWHCFVLLCIGTCYGKTLLISEEHEETDIIWTLDITGTLHFIFHNSCYCARIWKSILEVYNITKMKNIAYSFLTIIIVLLKQQVQLVVLCVHLGQFYCLIEITIAT